MCSACAGDDVRAEKYRCRGEKQASRWDVTVPEVFVESLFVCTLATSCNPFIVFHSHLRLNDCSNFRIPSFFIECESTASAEGEQRLARAKLKRAWNLLCRTETKQPRTRKNQRQISRETLCVTLSFFFELAIQLSIVRSPKVAASD